VFIICVLFKSLSMVVFVLTATFRSVSLNKISNFTYVTPRTRKRDPFSLLFIVFFGLFFGGSTCCICVKFLLSYNPCLSLCLLLWRVVPLRQQPYKFWELIYFWHQPVTVLMSVTGNKRSSLEDVSFIGRHLYNYNCNHHNHWSCCSSPLAALVFLSWSPAC
jgi:hypothetical protein